MWAVDLTISRIIRHVSKVIRLKEFPWIICTNPSGLWCKKLFLYFLKEKVAFFMHAWENNELYPLQHLSHGSPNDVLLPSFNWCFVIRHITIVEKKTKEKTPSIVIVSRIRVQVQ